MFPKLSLNFDHSVWVVFNIEATEIVSRDIWVDVLRKINKMCSLAVEKEIICFIDCSFSPFGLHPREKQAHMQSHHVRMNLAALTHKRKILG